MLRKRNQPGNATHYIIPNIPYSGKGIQTIGVGRGGTGAIPGPVSIIHELYHCTLENQQKSGDSQDQFAKA